MEDEVPEGSGRDAMIDESCQSAIEFITKQCEFVTSAVILIAYKDDNGKTCFFKELTGSVIECKGLISIAEKLEDSMWMREPTDKDDEE